jgi:hypothetical protein
MRVRVASLVGLLALFGADPAHPGVDLRDTTCDYEAPVRPTLLTQGVPQRELVEALGVLRRPRTSADFLPDLAADLGLRKLHLRYVRRAPGELGADQHFVATGAFPRLPARPPRHCLRGRDARTRRTLIRNWSEVRTRPVEALCLVEYAADGTPLGNSCFDNPVKQLNDGFVLGMRRVRGRLSNLAGIVPDGVVSIEARYRAGPPRTARVVDNVWALEDLRRADRAEPVSIAWFDAAGREIKEIRIEPVELAG